VPEWAEWKAQEIVTLAAPKDLGSLYWAENYRRQMSRDRLGEVYAQLLEIEKRTGREPVLLCYEKDANNCHRTILWNMLRDEFGVEGGELGQVGLGL